MMYKDNFVLAVKCGGKVLREFKDNVYIPFGSEYSLYLKNLFTRRAKARIWIDGKEATEDVDLIIPANTGIDLERFIKDGNLKAGNKFKFIERTAGVEAHRGIQAEDGLLRVEFSFEVAPAPVRPLYGYRKNGILGIPIGTGDATPCSGTDYYSTCNSNGSLTKSLSRNIGETACDSSSHIISEVTGTSSFVNEAGITAMGSVSEQSFVEVTAFQTEIEKHVIILKLLGETAESAKVVEAVTVKHNPKCTSCGKTNKAKNKFCIECGTGLIIA